MPCLVACKVLGEREETSYFDCFGSERLVLEICTILHCFLSFHLYTTSWFRLYVILVWVQLSKFRSFHTLQALFMEFRHLLLWIHGILSVFTCQHSFLMEELYMLRKKLVKDSKQWRLFVQSKGAISVSSFLQTNQKGIHNLTVIWFLKIFLAFFLRSGWGNFEFKIADLPLYIHKKSCGSYSFYTWFNFLFIWHHLAIIYRT